jgi:hypothetical protein
MARSWTNTWQCSCHRCVTCRSWIKCTKCYFSWSRKLMLRVFFPRSLKVYYWAVVFQNFDGTKCESCDRDSFDWHSFILTLFPLGSNMNISLSEDYFRFRSLVRWYNTKLYSSPIIKPTRCTNFWNLFLEWNSTYRVIQEESALLWEMIVWVILSK